MGGMGRQPDLRGEILASLANLLWLICLRLSLSVLRGGGGWCLSNAMAALDVDTAFLRETDGSRKLSATLDYGPGRDTSG